MSEWIGLVRVFNASGMSDDCYFDNAIKYIDYIKDCYECIGIPLTGSWCKHTLTNNPYVIKAINDIDRNYLNLGCDFCPDQENESICKLCPYFDCDNYDFNGFEDITKKK